MSRWLEGVELLNRFPFGGYISQRMFLPVFGIVLFIRRYWKQGAMTRLWRENRRQIALLLAVLLVTRFFSWGRWFYQDDYPMIARTNYSILSGDSKVTSMVFGGYQIALFLFVVPFFQFTYELYNALGILLVFLNGVMIYFLAGRLRLHRRKAVLVALFFVTANGYFFESVWMSMFSGTGFTLLLFILALYSLIDDYKEGAVLFFFAGLVFGLARAHFTALPMMIATVFFVGEKFRNKFSLLVYMLLFPLLSLYFLKDLGFAMANPHPIQSFWSHALIYSDVLYSLLVPYLVGIPLVFSLQWFWEGGLYYSAWLGILALVVLAGLIVGLLRKRKMHAAKMTVLGLVIFVSADLVLSYKGTGISYGLKYLNYNLAMRIPQIQTDYGFFPVFGVCFLLFGLSFYLKKKLFTRFMLILILFNVVGYWRGDYYFIKDVVGGQRRFNEVFSRILPVDDRVKIVYVFSDPTQRPLFEVLKNYVSLYYSRSRGAVLITDSPEDLVKKVVEMKPGEELYYFSFDDQTKEVEDLSVYLRGALEDGLSEEEISGLPR